MFWHSSSNPLCVFLMRFCCKHVSRTSFLVNGFLVYKWILAKCHGVAYVCACMCSYVCVSVYVHLFIGRDIVFMWYYITYQVNNVYYLQPFPPFYVLFILNLLIEMERWILVFNTNYIKNMIKAGNQIISHSIYITLKSIHCAYIPN